MPHAASALLYSAALRDLVSLLLCLLPQVYNIEQRGVEPVGGAARFAHAVRQHAAEQPLVLFSGDCLNPSLMSAFTRGEQMVPVLNHIGVHAAAVGNHDCEPPCILRPQAAPSCLPIACAAAAVAC